MSARFSVPIYARLGERELPVRWAWFRPEPEVGDTVRLQTAPNDSDEWRSFRVVRKRVHASEAPIIPGPSLGAMIHLDVEPIALQD